MDDLEAILAPVERAAQRLTNCDTCDGLGEVPVMPYHLRTPAELAMRADRQTTPCPACGGSGLTNGEP